MAIRGGDIISYLELDTGRYTAAMRAARAEAENFAEGTEGIGGRINAVMNSTAIFGRLLTVGVTTPVVTGFTGATNAAIGFESAFAGVRKTVDASEQGYARLSKGILEMGRVVPKAQDGLAGIMEIAGQLGVKEKDLLGFTRTIADLAVATNLTEEAGASMLAQFANVMGMDLGNIDRLGSVIVDLGNNTATTEAAIVEMAQRLSGAGALLGLTEAQVMGLAATMAALGINAEAGGSAMSRILQRMFQATKTGGDALNAFAKTAGMSAEQFQAAFGKDPVEAMIAFVGGLNQINESGGNVYETLEEVSLQDIRVTDTLLRVAGAGDMVQENIDRANKAWKENNALTKEAEERYKTTESRITLAKNSIREAGINLGNIFLPVVGEAADNVGGLAQKFADLDEATQRNVVKGLGITAMVGPAMLATKGLIGLLSGPGGVVAAAGLAAAAIVAIKTKEGLDALEVIDESFGNIVLSAEEVERIVKKGFGKPEIDFVKVRAAREEAGKAEEQFITLQNQLSKDVYLAKLGIAPMTQADAKNAVGTLITSAQNYLDLEENAAKITVKAYFSDSEKGTSMASDIEAFFNPLRLKLEAKGKELLGAFGSGITDKETKDKIITDLMNEIVDITIQGGLMKTQAERDVMIAKIRNRGLSAESVKDAVKQIDEYGVSLQSEYDTALDLMLTVAANMKNYGQYSKEKYDAEVAAILAEYGWKSAGVDMQKIEIGWAMFGTDLSRVVGEMAQGYSKFAGRAWWGMSPQERAELQAPKILFGELEPIFNDLTRMEQELGDELPEKYKKYLELLTVLKKMAEKGTIEGLSIPTPEELDALFSDGAQGAQDGANALSQGAETGMSGLPDSFSEIGENAVNSFTGKLSSGTDKAQVAGRVLGASAAKGMKEALGIASPSRVAINIARNVIDTTSVALKAGIKKVRQAAVSVGSAIAVGENEGYQSGYRSRVLAGLKDYRNNTIRAIEEIAEKAEKAISKTKPIKTTTTTTTTSAPKVVAGSRQPTAPLLDLKGMGAITDGLESDRERLLRITGAWRPYYDKSKIDLELEAIADKYKRLEEAESDFFEKLTKKQQETEQKAHEERLEKIRTQAQEEAALTRETHSLQKQIALDYLSSRADALSAAIAQKQEEYQRDDYEKELADLEKRRRQTRSARERRELTEEIDRLIRDEETRLERQRLNETLAGFNAMREAVSKGVIGLGDLIQDRTLTDLSFGAGLQHVQGITAEQLAEVLKSSSEGIGQGNHYTIDLRGAVVRDDSDIERIIAAFEQSQRSVMRSLQ